jgi:adenosine deaminase
MTPVPLTTPCSESYADLQAFLDVFQIGAQVLVTQLDFQELAEAYLDKAAANNVTHVELFFDAQNHAKR